MRLAGRFGILPRKAEFARFISRPDGPDVDAGTLRKLLSDEARVKLRK